MKASFLHSVASELLGDRERFIERALVFPSKQSRLQFTNILKEILDSPIRLPEMLTVSQFYERMSGLRLADDIGIKGVLESMILRDLGQNHVRFIDRFLQDIKQIEAYGVDAEKAFRHGRALHEISWGSTTDSVIQFLEAAPKLKEGIDDYLIENGLGYASLLQSQAVAGIDTDDSYCFVGFVVFNEREKQVLKALGSRVKFYWDLDEGLMDNTHVREQDFIRNSEKPDSLLQDGERTVAWISCSGVQEQAREVERHLKAMEIQDDERVGVILADEDLVEPMLLQLKSKGLKIQSSAGISTGRSKVFHTFKSSVLRQKTMSWEALQAALPQHELIDPFEKACAQKLRVSLRSICANRDGSMSGIQIKWALRKLENETVFLAHEEDAQIYLMGMLETRALDFDHLVFCSLNEGLLQGRMRADTLLPFETRKSFGFPDIEHQDELYSYYFFRLFKRCKTALMLHISSVSDITSGEESRLTKQLRYLEGLSAQRRGESAVNTPLRLYDEAIQVDEQFIRQSLKEYLANGISPTAINTSVADPMAFFFQFVMNVREPDHRLESPERIEMGNYIHKLLEVGYTGMEGKPLTEHSLDEVSRRIDAQAFEIEHGLGKYGYLRTIGAKSAKKVVELDRERIRSGESIQLISLEHKAEYQLHTDIKLRGMIDRVEIRDGIVHLIDYKSGNVKPSELKVHSISEVFASENYGKSLQLMSYAVMQKEAIQFHGGVTLSILPVLKNQPDFIPFNLNKTSTLSVSDVLQFEDFLFQHLQKLPESLIQRAEEGMKYFV